MKSIFKLKDHFVERVWGYEKWMLSTHKNGKSLVDGEQKDLLEYIGKELPILIKEIKADETLSVQVHPTDEYAHKNEGDNGKTECWYIVDAKKDATLICGIEDGLNKEKFLDIINNNEVEKYLKRITVKKGDMIYIPAGTVHAIEGGMKLIEVQESSDVTYRIYDWGRNREIHVNKAIDVINFNNDGNYGKIEEFKTLETPYFTVNKINVNKEYKDKINGYTVYICLNGNGNITSIDGSNLIINEGDYVYVKENTEHCIEGNLELLKIF